MKIPSPVPVLFIVAFLLSCNPAAKQNTALQSASDASIAFVENETEKKIDVVIDGKLFTSYRWPDSVYKPILYPIISAGGSTITRGFPLDPREGESHDHRHQAGSWLNYGNVNGYDFWGNGHAGARSPNGGEIKHLAVRQISEGKGKVSLSVAASWLDPSGKELLAEETVYHFIATDSVRIIDRVTALTATGTEPVNFKDTKEGMFGIRVARELELPSGDETSHAAMNAEQTMPANGATGNYRSSEGITGSTVWGTRARWMQLYGNVGKESVSVIICDHPGNIGYPTYWHARGYGLFAANPLGVKDFTGGKEELNFKLAAGESLTFRYRIVLTSGHHPTDAEIDSYADEFAKKY